jgi:hypothetical protein
MIDTSQATDFINDPDVLCLSELEDEIEIDDGYGQQSVETGNEDEKEYLQDEEKNDFLSYNFFRKEPFDQELDELASCSKKEITRKKRKQGTHGHQVFCDHQVITRLLISITEFAYLFLKDPKKARTAQIRKWGSAGDQVTETHLLLLQL